MNFMPGVSRCRSPKNREVRSTQSCDLYIRYVCIPPFYVTAQRAIQIRKRTNKRNKRKYGDQIETKNDTKTRCANRRVMYIALCSNEEPSVMINPFFPVTRRFSLFPGSLFSLLCFLTFVGVCLYRPLYAISFTYLARRWPNNHSTLFLTSPSACLKTPLAALARYPLAAGAIHATPSVPQPQPKGSVGNMFIRWRPSSGHITKVPCLRHQLHLSSIFHV